MNRKQWTLLVAGFLIMAMGAAALVQMKSAQRLGMPGVLTRPLAESRNLEVVLPERVLDYTSEFVPTDKMVIEVLPADTSFGARHYTAPDKFEIKGSVVLMGADRTSLHKPQYCLQGAGLQLVSTERTNIPIQKPFRYDLPVTRINVVGQRQVGNQTVADYGVYVYWYVADQAISGDPSGAERMWSSAKHLLQTGELQRWAYVSFLAGCAKGEEDAAFQRLSEFIAAAVPDFHVTQPVQNVIAVGGQ